MPTVLVDVLEQDLARHVAALRTAHEGAGRAPARHGLGRSCRGTQGRDVVHSPARGVAQRGEPERAVVACVLLECRRAERRLEEANHDGDDELTGHLALTESAGLGVGSSAARRRNRGGARTSPRHLPSAIASGTGTASARASRPVACGHAFPHGRSNVGPRRRDCERADPFELGGAPGRAAIGIRYRNTAGTPAADARLLIGHVLGFMRRTALTQSPCRGGASSGDGHLVRTDASRAARRAASPHRGRHPQRRVRVVRDRRLFDELDQRLHRGCRWGSDASGPGSTKQAQRTARRPCRPVARRPVGGCWSTATDRGLRRLQRAACQRPLRVGARPWSSSSGHAFALRLVVELGLVGHGTAVGRSPRDDPTRCHRSACGSPCFAGASLMFTVARRSVQRCFPTRRAREAIFDVRVLSFALLVPRLLGHDKLVPGDRAPETECSARRIFGRAAFHGSERLRAVRDSIVLVDDRSDDGVADVGVGGFLLGSHILRCRLGPRPRGTSRRSFRARS